MAPDYLFPRQSFCEDYTVLKKELKKCPHTKVASLVGRYYALDRDRQYADRTRVAYNLFTMGVGKEWDDLCKGVEAWYKKAPKRQKTDYYITSLKTKDFTTMTPGDVVICANFRTDRMLQIVHVLEDEEVKEIPRLVRIEDVICIGPYSEHLPVVYPEPEVKNTLGEVVSKAGGKQLRIAETDKMAHVTFFFNAQRDDPFPNEDHILVDSPKVPNFASTPEMSADELTDKLIEQVEGEKYDLVVANYANPDLVGHGASVEAAIVACETVDRNLARVLPVLEEHGYEWIITADHGNIEDMLLPDGSVSPSHTANPVQTFVHSEKFPDSESLKEKTGIKDIAPMVLTIMDQPIPEEMQ